MVKAAWRDVVTVLTMTFAMPRQENVPMDAETAGQVICVNKAVRIFMLYAFMLY